MEETSDSTCQSREKVVEAGVEVVVVASVEVEVVVALVEVAVAASVEVAVVASEEAVVDLVEIAEAGVVVSEDEAVIAVVVSSVLPSVQIEEQSCLVKVRKFFLTEWYLVDESRLELVAKAPNVPVWLAIKHQKVFCGSCPM